MAANCGKYSGLDRADCRKALWADMKAAGLVIKEEPYTLRVPRSQRGGEVIEPLVSEQWFVKMDGMAAQALTALEQGDLKILPQRFEKVYTNWLGGIQARFFVLCGFCTVVLICWLCPMFWCSWSALPWFVLFLSNLMDWSRPSRCTRWMRFSKHDRKCAACSCVICCEKLAPGSVRPDSRTPAGLVCLSPALVGPPHPRLVRAPLQGRRRRRRGRWQPHPRAHGDVCRCEERRGGAAEGQGGPRGGGGAGAGGGRAGAVTQMVDGRAF